MYCSAAATESTRSAWVIVVVIVRVPWIQGVVNAPTPFGPCAISLSVKAIASAESRKVMWISVCAISTLSL